MFHVRDGKFKEATHNDVIMALEEIETVRYGQPYKIRVKLQNLSTHRKFNFCAELRVFFSENMFLHESVVIIYSYILVHQIW